jgi:excisionase family DNA binding protein
MELAAAMSVREAASLLGVDPRQVRRLVVEGVLPATRMGNQWLVDRSAVAARAQEVQGPGRPLSPRGAWALLDMLDGRRSALPAGEAGRLRARARAVDPRATPRRWRIWLSRRARPEFFAADADALADLLADPRIARGAASVRHSAVPPGGRVMAGGAELYVPAAEAARIIDEYSLLPSNRPNLVIRIPSLDSWPLPAGSGDVPPSVEAADLLDARDSRSVQAGAALLAALQQRWLEPS